MLSQTAKRVLRVLGVLLVLAVLGCGLFLWRLSSGPVSLGLLTPYVVTLLEASFPGHEVEVPDLVLTWSKQPHRLKVEARHVAVLTPRGLVVATFPRLDVTLSPQALLRGTVALTAVEIERAYVKLIRQADGSWHFGQLPLSEVEPAAGLARRGRALIRALVAKPDPSRPLAYLDEVRVLDSRVELFDVASQQTWNAAPSALSLHQVADGLRGTFKVAVTSQGTRADVAATLNYTPDTRQTGVEVSFRNLLLSGLAPLLPAADDLAGLDVPVTGAITMRLDARLALQDLRFEITGSSGTLAHSSRSPAPLPITDLRLNGHLDGRRQRLQLDQALLTWEAEAQQTATVRLSGTAIGLAGDLEVAAQLQLVSVRLGDLTSRLPAGVRASLRAWLTAPLLGGTVDAARASVGLHIPGGKLRAASITALDGTLHGHLAGQANRPAFEVTGAFDDTTKRVHVQASATHLQPAAFGAAVPTLRPLAGLEAPFEGTVVVETDQALRLQALRFEMAGGPGRLTYPEFLPEPRPVSTITLHGHFEQATAALRLDDITVGLGSSPATGPTLRAHGAVTGFGEDLSLQGEVTLTDFRMADLDHYWPVGVVTKTRAWLTTNLVAGAVDRARMTFALTLPRQTPGTPNVTRLDGSIRYRDCEVHYLRPLPPMTGVSGQARFNRQGFRIDIASGTGAGLRLTTGELQITGLDAGRDAMTIRLQVESPLRAALTLLDHPELNLLDAVDVEPAATSGQVQAQTTFAFSLLGDVPIDAVDVTVHAALSEVAMRNVLLGQDADHGHLVLDLDKAGMTVTGPIQVAAIPIQLDWHEAFRRDTAWKSTMRARTTGLDPAALARFALDLAGMVGGAPAATVVSKTDWHGQQTIEADVDLRQTTLRLPLLGWHKPVGAPGHLQGAVQLHDKRGQGHFRLAAETLTTQGTVEFGLTEPAETRVVLRDVTIANTQLESVSLTHRQQHFDVHLGPGVLDASALIHSGSSNGRVSNQPASDGEADQAGVSQSPGSQVSVRVLAPALRRVLFGSGRYLEAVQLELSQTPRGWKVIDIAGRAPGASGSSPFALQYRPASEGVYRLAIQIADLGALLRASNVHDGLEGGSVSLDGQGAGALPIGPLQGTLRIKDMRVIDAPILARILSAASLTGFLDLMQGEGLLFSWVEGEVALQDGGVTSDLIHAKGGGLGLTASGALHLQARNLDVTGTIIPLQALNTLPGKIPLLGKLIVGGEGQGLIAVNYRLQGQLADPKVTVNPASALTPGFLRKVFDLFDGNEAGNDK